MKIKYYLVLIQLIIISALSPVVNARSFNYQHGHGNDTLSDSHLLYNGRIWRDIYVSIKEDQFLFSSEFLPGRVTMNGKTFSNLKLRYDIMNDEIITVTDKGIILQLNKEMIDNFTVTYQSRIYNFANFVADSLSKVAGYVNVLYKGKSSLYIKYFKEISKRGPGKNYENFVQDDKVYVVKDDIINQVRNNGDFKNLVSDKKHEIKTYLKGNKIKISRKSPDTYVSVLEYYDSLR